MNENATPDTPSRRRYLAATGGIAAAALAGCRELLTGDAAEFEAGPSRVGAEALDETGYELAGRSDQVVEREFEAGGESRDVVVTNKLAKYRKTVSLGPLGEIEGAIFTSLTTPKVEVLGEEFNPVAEMSTAELARTIQDQYDGVENLREESESQVSVAGERTTQTTFRADAAIEGSPVELFVHVTEAVEMGEDLVVTVGVYPALTPGEEENIFTLMGAVEPGTD